MEQQRVLQLMFNWLMVNHYLTFEPATTGEANASRYRVTKRDPFYVTNYEIPTQTLEHLHQLVTNELELRKNK